MSPRLSTLQSERKPFPAQAAIACVIGRRPLPPEVLAFGSIENIPPEIMAAFRLEHPPSVSSPARVLAPQGALSPLAQRKLAAAQALAAEADDAPVVLPRMPLKHTPGYEPMPTAVEAAPF